MLTKSTNISKCFYTSLFFSKHIYTALNKTDPLTWSCSVRLPFVPKNWDGQWMTSFWEGGRRKENNKDGAYNHTDRQVWKIFTTMATQIREVYWIKKICWRWYGCIVNKIKRTIIIKKLQLFLAPLKQPIKPFCN